MKKFQTPEVELVKFAMIDVIATSTEEPAPTDDPFAGIDPVMGLGNCV